MLANTENIITKITTTNTPIKLKKDEYTNYLNLMDSLKSSISPDEARYYKSKIESLFNTAILREQDKIRQ